MKEKGAEFSKIKLEILEVGYRGVVAQERIKSGETILFVPLS